MPNRTDRYNPSFRQLLFPGVLVTIGVVIFWQLIFSWGHFRDPYALRGVAGHRYSE